MFANTQRISPQHSTVLTREWFVIDGFLAVLATIHSGGNLMVSLKAPETDEDYFRICADFETAWFKGTLSFLNELCDIIDSIPRTMDNVGLSFIRSVSGSSNVVRLD